MLEPRHILDVKKQQIKEGVINLFTEVDNAIRQAIKCLDTRDIDDCLSIIHNDNMINEKRRLLEQDALIAIASQQPVAHDLREIIAAMRIVTELERMADYAADIAASVMEMDATEPTQESKQSLFDMSDVCLKMSHAVSTAYSENNAEQAKEISALDDKIDAALKHLSKELLNQMKSAPELVENASRMLWIAHNLERCGDRLTNIAEQVVFITDSEVVDLN